MKDFSWQGPRRWRGVFSSSSVHPLPSQPWTEFCPFAARSRLRGPAFCARSCPEPCWRLHSGSGAVTETPWKLRSRRTRGCLFVSPKLLEFSCCTHTRQDGCLCAGPGTLPVRGWSMMDPRWMPLGSAVKQINSNEGKVRSGIISVCSSCPLI